MASKIVPFPLKTTVESELAVSRNADQAFFHALTTSEQLQWMVQPVHNAIQMMTRVGEFSADEALGITGLFNAQSISPEHSVLVLYGPTRGAVRYPFLLVQRYKTPTVAPIKRAAALNEKVMEKLQQYISSWDATQLNKQPLVQAAAPVFFFAYMTGEGATVVKHTLPEKFAKGEPGSVGSLTMSLARDPGWLYEIKFNFDVVDSNDGL